MKKVKSITLVVIVGLAALLPLQIQSATVAKAKGYTVVSINTPFVAKTNGFVVVKLVANPNERTVIAQGVVDGEIIASASAADNTGSIISTGIESFTFPVRQGSKWEVDSTIGGSGIEVRWFNFGVSF